MRVSLIIPPARRGSLSPSFRLARGLPLPHPHTLLTAMAMLEREGHEALFLDEAFGEGKGEALGAIGEDGAVHAGLVAVHPLRQVEGLAARRIEALRNRARGLVVAVGPVAAAQPSACLAAGAHAVCAGEYETALRHLAARARPEAIPGLILAGAGPSAVHTSRPRPTDLAVLPFPLWRWMRPEWYAATGRAWPLLTLATGRGWDGPAALWPEERLLYGRQHRTRPPKQVVEEMDYDRKLFPRLREIALTSPASTHEPHHMRSLCQLLLSRHERPPRWSAPASPAVEQSLLPLMAKAGCHALELRFGCDQLDQASELARKAAGHGMRIHGVLCLKADDPAVAPALNAAPSLPLDTLGVALVAPSADEALPQTGETVLCYARAPKGELRAMAQRALRRFYAKGGRRLKLALSARSLRGLRLLREAPRWNTRMPA